MLYIATAELRAFKAQRFAANERDGLGLDLAYMPSGLFAIHELFGSGVPEDHMGQFVQCGFMRERGKGIHCDFAPGGETLNVAIHFLKWRARDVQSTKCPVDVKAGNRRSICALSLGLYEHKPIRPKPEGVACLRFGRLILDAIGLGGFFERHGHAKGDSFLALSDLPFPFKPSLV